MNPELRDRLLVCADRAEELGDEVALDVLHRLAEMEDGTSLEGFGRRLLYIARFRDLLGPGAPGEAPSPARVESAEPRR